MKKLPFISLDTTSMTFLFWAEIMKSAQKDIENFKDTFPIIAKKNDSLRQFADYNTGAIGLDSATSLWSIISYFMPENIVEIGTFIGNSAHAMATAIEKKAINTHNIFTCDYSNNIDLFWDYKKTKIKQFQKKSSTDMLASLVEDHSFKVDFLYLDGRLQKKDFALLSKLYHSQTIIAADDFERNEKGVINLNFLQRTPLAKSHILITSPQSVSKELLSQNLPVKDFDHKTGLLVPKSLFRYKR